MTDKNNELVVTTYESINDNLLMNFEKVMQVAEMMSKAVATVPNHLQGNPSDCAAVVMQAMQWKMFPFAVAQKTHLVNGILGYEAQLISAVLNSCAPIKGRLEYDWFGTWENVIGKFKVCKNSDGKEYRVADYSLADEAGLGVRVSATMKGEDKPRVLELLLAQARTRNSTMWADDPKQQLAYLATKKWSRLHCPEVIMGVYSPDELEEVAPIVVNPEVDDSPRAKPQPAETPAAKTENPSTVEATYEVLLTPPMVTYIRTKGLAVYKLVSETDVCNHFKVDALESIPATRFEEVKNFIKETHAAKASAGDAGQAENTDA